MRTHQLYAAGLALSTLIGAGRLEAQGVVKEAPPASGVALTRAGIGSRPHDSIGTDTTEHGSLPALLAAGRSRLVAGAASAFLPGLGSFYAGHARHGAMHLLVHVVAGTYVLAGSTNCISAWGGDTKCSDAALNVAAIGWLVNWGWSIVSAVNDASAFNARR